MGLLFLYALLAKPCSHRDNEGLICLQQYGDFLHNLHVFFKAQTLSNEVTNSTAWSLGVGDLSLVKKSQPLLLLGDRDLGQGPIFRAKQ